MPQHRKLVIDIAIATFLSGMFGAVLVYQIMAGGVGTSITFTEFISSSQNVIFTLLMCSFVFASWIMRGPNNRMVLFCWAIVMIIYQALLWSIYNRFYYQDLNIYILNFVGVISMVPALVFLRYRVAYTVKFFEVVGRMGFFSRSVDRYLSSAKNTDFEFYMKQNMYAIFFVELAYSVYQTAYVVIYNIPHNGSIYEHLMRYNHWDPFYSYIFIKNVLSCIYIVIIGIHLYRDHKVRDAFAYGMSDAQIRATSLQMLENRRAKARKKLKK